MERTPLFTLAYQHSSSSKRSNKNNMKQSKNPFKSFGFISIGLCVLCCALPIIGVVATMGFLTLLSRYFEWAALGGMILAVVFFGIYGLKKRKAPACDIDCGCKNSHEEANQTGQPSPTEILSKDLVLHPCYNKATNYDHRMYLAINSIRRSSQIGRI